MDIPAYLHTYSRGIHTGPFIASWNGLWEAFIEEAGTAAGGTNEIEILMFRDLLVEMFDLGAFVPW